MENKKYFTIHSVAALKAKDFSIIRANIENTQAKLEIAKGLFDSENYYFEFHNYKQDIRAVVR